MKGTSFRGWGPVIIFVVMGAAVVGLWAMVCSCATRHTAESGGVMRKESHTDFRPGFNSSWFFFFAVVIAAGWLLKKEQNG